MCWMSYIAASAVKRSLYAAENARLVAALQLDAFLFAVALTERVEQPVAPRARGVGEDRFDALLIDLGDRARRRSDDEENARERRVGDVLVDGGVASVELLFEDLLAPSRGTRRV